MSEEWRQVKLPADLCLAAERRWGRQFSTIEELLTVVLRQLSKDEAAAMDEAEQHVIEERLRGLGYI